MHFIGDVHGKINKYKSLLRDMDYSIQIGDMGIGFPGIELDLVHPNHKFIRGNHDSPDVCRQHSNYLGDYGFIEECGIFYVGGAWSIDAAFRTAGVTWWADEELSYDEFNQAAKLYYEKKPKIMVTHEGPSSITTEIILNHSPFQTKEVINNKTMLELDKMFQGYQPEIWIFGHHHVSYRKTIKGTQFICLEELETYEIKGLEYKKSP